MILSLHFYVAHFLLVKLLITDIVLYCLEVLLCNLGVTLFVIVSWYVCLSS